MPLPLTDHDRKEMMRFLMTHFNVKNENILIDGLISRVYTETLIEMHSQRPEVLRWLQDPKEAFENI